MKALKAAFALMCLFLAVFVLISRKEINLADSSRQSSHLAKLSDFQIVRTSGNGMLYSDLEESIPFQVDSLFSQGRLTAKADRQTSFEFFHQHCLFTALPETHIHYRGDTAELTLFNGEIFWKNPGQNQQHLILRGDGDFVALGESGRLRLNPQMLEIWNYQGKSEATVNQQNFQLEALQYLQVSSNRRPLLQSLPAAPKITSTQSLAINLQNPGDAITTFHWRSSDEATNFIFRLFSSPLKDNQLFNKTVPSNTLTLNLLHYASWGNLYWEIAALDRRSNLDGPPSALGYIRLDGKLFEREKRVMPPRLIIQSLSVSGDMVLIRGETSPFCRVFINDSEVKVDAQGTFTYTLSFPGIGTKDIEFRAINAAGAETIERRQVVIFSE